MKGREKMRGEGSRVKLQGTGNETLSHNRLGPESPLFLALQWSLLPAQSVPPIPQPVPTSFRGRSQGGLQTEFGTCQEPYLPTQSGRRPLRVPEKPQNA